MQQHLHMSIKPQRFQKSIFLVPLSYARFLKAAQGAAIDLLQLPLPGVKLKLKEQRSWYKLKVLKRYLQEEREEAELTQRWEQISAQKEMLSIETQLAAADAKIKVYDELDGRSSVLSRQKETVKRLYFTSAQYDEAEDAVDGEGQDVENEAGDDEGDELADDKNYSHVAAQLPGQSSYAPRGEKRNVPVKGR